MCFVKYRPHKACVVCATSLKQMQSLIWCFCRVSACKAQHIRCSYTMSSSASAWVAQATCCSSLAKPSCNICCVLAPLRHFLHAWLSKTWAEHVLSLSAVQADKPVIIPQAHPPESGVCWSSGPGASCHISRQPDEQQHMAGDS